jgi:hypothetical protein
MINASTTLRIESPWPGPRPYDISEGGLFFGRENEIEEVRRMILRERVTILSAESGAGKTSLLRAGLIYTLIHDRSRQLQAKGSADISPVLLLTEWGGGLKTSVGDLFSASLQAGVNKLAAIAPHDYDLLTQPIELASPERALEKPARTGVIFFGSRRRQEIASNGLEDHQAPSQGMPGSEPLTFLDEVSQLCDRSGGIILVFDQFEEVLRAGEEAAGEAVEIIKRIYKYERRARIVLSLRSEYHKDLHGLERYVGGLYTRTFFLPPMAAGSVQEAVQNSARAAHMSVEPSVVKSLVELLVLAGSKRQTYQVAFSLVEPVTEGEQLEETFLEKKVDLLTLQAILRELFAFWKDKYPDALEINSKAFEDYIAGRDPAELMGQALSRWIQNSLNQPYSRSCSHYHAGLQSVSPALISGMVNRIGSRMASYLSSGGYKVSAEEMDLMYYTLRLEFYRLHPKFDATQQDDWEIIQTDPPILDRALLQLNEKYSLGSSLNLSGIARQFKWSPADTADILVSLFFETLYRLQEGNIIKPVRVRENQVWELVHDGLGRPFSLWAERKKDTWDDCIYNLTASRGVDIYIPANQRKDQTAEKVRWQGCFITASEGEELENYIFEDCDLKGTVFENCRFRGGGFINCIMDGTLFINCVFEATPDGVPFRFEQVTANAMTFLTPQETAVENRRSVMNGVVFDRSNLSQVKFAGVNLKQNVVFTGETELFLCHFTRLETPNPRQPAKIFLDGAKWIHCVWDRESSRLIDFYNMIEHIGGGQR